MVNLSANMVPTEKQWAGEKNGAGEEYFTEQN
jgi:hypothetical protein